MGDEGHAGGVPAFTEEKRERLSELSLATPVAAFLLRRGRLPVFLGLFESYGGPWTARVSHATFAVL